MAEVRLEQVRVRHPGATDDALAGIDLHVPDRTRTVLLGGSGSGKTTLLRAVAGLVPLTAGVVRLAGQDVTDWSPGDRDLAMVRQEGTLIPHLDVRRNVGFSLRLRRVPRDEERRRVSAEARAFHLEHLLDRRPSTLAAGERHEVALARSLVRRASALLLDEPFARTDASRRAQLRRELLRMQQGYGMTTILATNDPEAAHALADQVAVLERGRLVQTGPPIDVAARPATALVAGLLLLPAPNLVRGTIEHRTGRDVLVAGPLQLDLRRRLASRHVLVGVRPDHLEVLPAERGGGVVVPVRRRATLGDRVELTIGPADRPTLRVHADRSAPEEGDQVVVRADPRHVHVFDAASGAALLHGL